MNSDNAAKGSFGIPPEMQEEIERSKRKAAGMPEEESKAYDSESIPEVDPELPKSEKEDEDVKQDTKEKVDYEKMYADIRSQLGLEITEDDVWDFILNGTLTKTDVVIIPKRLHATFKSLTLDQSNGINRKMAVLLKEDILEDGYKGIQTQELLSLGLLQLGKPGHLKSIGETPEERFKQLGGMSTFLIRKLGEKWNSFSVLLANSLEENEDIKKP